MQMWTINKQFLIRIKSNTLEEKMDLIVFNEDCKKKSVIEKSPSVPHGKRALKGHFGHI